MKISLVVLAVIALISAVSVMPLFRLSPFWGRKRLSERELQKIFGNRALALDALRLVGSCYKVPIGFLRPGDTFSNGSALQKCDDVVLGLGQEKLNEVAREKGLEGQHPDWTVGDFVEWYVDAVGSK